MQVVFDGTLDEICNEMEGFLRQSSTAPAVPPFQSAGEGVVKAAVKAAEDISPAIRGELRAITPDARRALWHICSGAPRVGFDEIASALGVSTQTLGGYMSSLGHSAPTLHRMIKRDYPRRDYVVDPAEAETITEELRTVDAESARR